MRWRGILRLLLALFGTSPAIQFAAGPRAIKPDILIIMPDQFRGDCLSALGHPVLRTPTLDGLAAEGTLFRRGYATVPSCIPARFALLTGQEPQTSGIIGFASHPITVPTLPAVLAQAGYATALVGRNMHQLPATDSLGYETRLFASTYIADDDYDVELKRALPDSGGIRGIVGLLRLDNNRWPAAPWPYPEPLHPTAWIVRRSREVATNVSVEKPLFLTTSFYAPHPPLFPPARLFDHFLGSKLPPPSMGSWVNRAALQPEGNRSGDRVLLEGETLRRAQAGYFGLIEQIDEQIAGLVSDFKARSARAGRGWIIVVISDHGEMLGDHGYFRKCEPYEGAANIPFIIATSPSLNLRQGTRSLQPVGQEDIMPTLLELAQVPRPETVDGRSLVPILEEPDARVRDWLHLEHAPTYNLEQGFHALTDGAFKYIWRPHAGTEQLFDLMNDPHEEHDLAGEERHRSTLVVWRTRLIGRLQGRPEGFSDGKALIAGREYPRIQISPKKTSGK